MTDLPDTNTARLGLRDVAARARGALWMALLFSLAINLLMLTAPLYMQQIFDRVVVSRSIDTLLYLSLLAGIALLVMWGLDAIRGRILATAGVWIERRLGGLALEASVNGARAFAPPSTQGVRDVATVRNFMTGQGLFPFFDAPWTPLFLVVVFFLHPVLGWIALGGAVVIFGLALANDLLSRNLGEHAARAANRADRIAETATRNADSLAAMGMLGGAVDRWHRENDQALAAYRNAAARTGTITGAAKALRMALQIGLMGCGAYLVVQNELTSGAMIASSILMSRALSPVEQAIGSWRSAVAARAAWRRLGERLGDTVAPLRMALPAPTGRLTAETVRFAHRGAAEPLIHGVSFQLEPGECLGLVGPTAAGKSTLARLLVGSLAPQLGHVRLDGADLAAWDPQDRGPHVGYLAQDVELLDGTVAENIARLGRIDPDTVVAAARAAGVHDLILSLPEGYETRIGQHGTILSGGQRQRIGLARALYGDPRLIVLDEPNASLDQEGEAALVRALDGLKSRKATVVVVTHRPALLRSADRILVLNAGRVERLAPRDEIFNRLAAVAPRRAAAAGA